MDKKVEIIYQEGHFWMICQDEHGEYHSYINQFDIINKLGQTTGEWVWSLQYKENNAQRKFRASSAVTKTIHAQIASIRVKMESGYPVCVARTPDIEVWFYNNK